MKKEGNTEEKGYTLFIPNFPEDLRRDIKIIAAKGKQGYQETIIEILEKECCLKLNTWNKERGENKGYG